MFEALTARMSGIQAARIRDRLAGHPFLANVAVVAGGTAAAQAIAVLSSPVLTRIFGPDRFGEYGVFTSVAAVMAAVSCLAYEHAIVLPSRHEDAVRVVRVSLAWALVTGVVALVVFVPFGRRIAPLVGLEAGSPYLLAIPFTMLFSGVAQTFDQWLIRTRQFRASSRIAVVQQLVTNGSAMLVGLVSPRALVLIMGYAAGRLAQAAMGVWSSRGSLIAATAGKSRLLQVPTAEDREVSAAYRDFPLYRAPQLLLSALAQGVPVVLLSAFFGPAAAGLYSIGRRVIMLPSAVIQQAVNKVFLQKVATAANEGQDLRRLIVRATAGLAAVGVIPFGAVVLFGPMLFGWVFGPEWVRAGEYARWLAVWAFFSFTNGPSVMAVPVLSLQGQYLGFQAVTEALRVGGMVWAATGGADDTAAVAWFAAIGTIANVVLIGAVVYLSSRRRRSSGTCGVHDPAREFPA